MNETLTTAMKIANQQFDADLAEVGRAVGYVAFDKKNDGQGYKYASAAAVLSKVNEALFAKGISIQPHVDILANETTAKGAQRVMVKVILRLTRGTDVRTFEGVGSGADHGDKAVMKAITAAHKYAYALAFCISWGDDPEADSSVDEAPAKPAAARANKAATKPANSKPAAFEDFLNQVVTAEASTLPSREQVVAMKANISPEQYTQLVNAHRAKVASFSKGE